MDLLASYIIKRSVYMGEKGLDFKHKEVINIVDGKRLGFVQDVTAELESRAYYIYYCSRKF